MKTCTICKQNKTVDAFNKRNRSRDGLQNVCRVCNSMHSKAYYLANTTKHRATTRKRRADKRRETKARIDALKTECYCCGEKELCCLDFHHVDSKQKEFSISEAISHEWSWSKVLREIRKCVVVCANCHRKIHFGVICLRSSTGRARNS